MLLSLALLLGLSSCQQVSFERIDPQGHVRIVREGRGYCFRIPKDWEIRENLEGADVACLGPLSDNFRETIVARTLSNSSFEDPEAFITSQLEQSKNGGVEFNHTIVESPKGEGEPVILKVEAGSISEIETRQLVYLKRGSQGEAVLFTCTTRSEKLDERRDFFHDIVSKAKFDITECGGPDGIPETFPTPEVTFTPRP